MKNLGAATFVILLGAGLVASCPAHADVSTTREPTGDVRFVSVSSTGEESSNSVLVPNRKLDDISQLRLSHGTSSVTLTLQLRALTASGGEKVFRFKIETYSLRRTVDVTAAPGEWRGRTALYDGGGDDANCTRMTHSINYFDARVTVVIPRSCLGFPSSVRARAGDLASTDRGFYYDTALVDGRVDPDGSAVTPYVSR